MKIILTERQLLILEKKTKYEYGFELLKRLVLKKFPYIKDIEYLGTSISERYYYLINVNVTIDKNKYKEYFDFEFRYSDSNISDLCTDIIGKIYDDLPKNVRYNYPDNHKRWPGEAAGVVVHKIYAV